jgi:hypothetical protein
MKLIINIDDKDYKKLKDGHIPFSILDVIQNGTPLDLIRAEIDRQRKWLLQAGCTVYNVDIAFDAIKSVVAERTENEAN